MATPESEVFDPTTPAARLAELAASHPQFGIAIVNHPNAYPALIDWIAQHGDPASRAAAATRIRATAATGAPAAPAAPRRPLGVAVALRGWLDGAIRVWRGDTDGALATPEAVRSRGGAALVFTLAPIVANAILLGGYALVLVAAPYVNPGDWPAGFDTPKLPGGVGVGVFFAGFGFSLLYVVLRALGLMGVGALRRTRIAPLAALETVGLGAAAATPLVVLAFALSFVGFGGIGGLYAVSLLRLCFGLVGLLVIEGVVFVWLGRRLGGPVPLGPSALAGGLAAFIAVGAMTSISWPV